MIQYPTVGRIVHYHTTEKDREYHPRAPHQNSQITLPAIITAVWSPTLVNLKVFNDGVADYWKTSVNISDDGKENSWSWPAINPIVHIIGPVSVDSDATVTLKAAA